MDCGRVHRLATCRVSFQNTLDRPKPRHSSHPLSPTNWDAGRDGRHEDGTGVVDEDAASGAERGEHRFAASGEEDARRLHGHRGLARARDARQQRELNLVRTHHLQTADVRRNSDCTKTRTEWTMLRNDRYELDKGVATGLRGALQNTSRSWPTHRRDSGDSRDLGDSDVSKTGARVGAVRS